MIFLGRFEQLKILNLIILSKHSKLFFFVINTQNNTEKK